MTFLLRRVCFALWLVLALAAIGGLQPATAAEPKRLALVVGNSAYSNISALVNPTNDATDIAAKLKSLQFEVLLGVDATHAKMTELLHQFKGKLTRNHIALVFYAGHGVTVNNESFLLPVDMPAVLDLDAEGKLTADALNRNLVSMAAMLAPLEDAKIGLVFLDACRTNLATPGLGLTLRTASLTQSRTARIMRGTGALDVKPSPYSAGVFRAYSTQLDNVASDGAGRNSPFTKALLTHMATKGLSIQELMIRVRKSVIAETKAAQVPWEEAALNEVFYFVPAAGSPSLAPLGKRPAAGRQPGTNLPPNLGVGVGTGL